MTADTFANLMIILFLGLSLFNLGQAYALIRETRKENERHIETMREIQKRRG